MHLHPATLLIATLCTLSVQGILLTFFWWQDRRAVALGIWGAAFLTGGLGVALFVSASLLPPVLSVGLANVLILLSYALMWAAARRFEGRTTSIFLILAAPAIWLLFFAEGTVVDSPPSRTAVTSFLVSILTTACAMELWRGRAERLPSRRPLIALYLSLAAMYFIRVIYTEHLVFSAQNGVWYAAFIFCLFVWFSVAAFLILALSKERMEINQRSNAMIDPVTGVLKRGAFMLQGARLVARLHAEQSPACLLLLSVDGRGGQASDAALHRFSERTLGELRLVDLMARMGRREFACVLANVSHGDALEIATRVHRVTASADGEANIRIGVSSTTQVGHDLRALIEAADAALEDSGSAKVPVVLYHPSLVRQHGLHDEQDEPASARSNIIPFSN